MAEMTATMQSTLMSLLEAKKYNTLRDILITMNPADIATLFGDLEYSKLPLLYRLLPKELAAETFIEMESDAQEMLIQGFSDKELRDVLDELYVDDAVDLVEEMPANVVKRILHEAAPEMRKQINELLRYPDDSAGSIMTTEFVTLWPDLTIEEAIKRIRRTGLDKETINTCYVTQNRKLVGVATIRVILLADDAELIGNIMEENVISVTTMTDQEDVVQTLSKYDFTAVPVVDGENRLVGIITIDDAMDVMEDEATEDIQKMAAMLPTTKPYLKTGILETWKSRIPWLMLLMVSATFTGMIISSFEDALAAYVVLTGFIPMLMDTGGNSGSQASVSVIRAISLNELEFPDLAKVIWKECRVAILCGFSLALVNFCKILLIDKLLLGNIHITLAVAAVVCLTLFITIVCAKIVGCILPMLAKKIGFDPAVMASPFITTIVDAVSLLIYFQLAKLMLGI
ncbi:MAG: magnesium transporter [Oscillospiraceae bacterium]|nr:magnesium transporter [Oscillospiraceae bacterium]